MPGACQHLTVDVQTQAPALNVGLAEFGINQGNSITIEKDVYPDAPGAPMFNFAMTPPAGTLDNSFDLADGDEETVDRIQPGTYVVTENNPLPAGYDLYNIECNDADTTVNLGARAATIILAETDNVRCRFTNNKQGRIDVTKTAIGGDGTFGYTLTGGPTVSIPNSCTTVGGTCALSFAPLATGYAYSLVETTVPAGWDQTAATCTGSVQGPLTPASFLLAPGESVQCAFENTKRGKIIIEKQTTPDKDPQEFPFAASYNAAGFKLADDQQNDSGWLMPGAYSVKEDLTGLPWDLVEPIVCTDDAGVGSDTSTWVIAGPQVDVTLGAGDTVTCTYNDHKWGKVIIDKVTDPTKSTKEFAFTGAVPGKLKDQDPPLEKLLPPGHHDVVETDPGTNWDLIDIQCKDGAGVPSYGEVGTRTAHIHIGLYPEEVTCTFTNRQRAKIVIVKKVVGYDSGGTFNFNHTLVAGDAPTVPTNPFPLIPTSGGSKTATISDVVPYATYHVAEQDPTPGWDLTYLECDEKSGGSVKNSTTNLALRLATITAEPGETITCTYTDTKRGRIKVYKVTDPANDPASFKFTTTGAGYGGFSLTQATSPNDSLPLAPGEYSVKEVDPTPAFDLESWSCTWLGDSKIDPSSTKSKAVIQLAAGDTVECTFNNTKRGTIIIRKTASPAPLNAYKFEFSQDIDGSGNFKLLNSQSKTFMYVKPGSYSVTEESNWWFDSVSCVGVQSDVARTAGSAQLSVNLAAGETVDCTFKNVNKKFKGISSTDLLVDENKVGESVGPFLASPVQGGETFVLTLTKNPPSCPGTDNSAFVVQNNYLRTKYAFDYETKKTYNVCVKMTDLWGFSMTKAFVIQVIDRAN